MFQDFITKLHLEKYISSWLILFIDTSVSAVSTWFAFLIISYLIPSALFTLHFGGKLTLLSGVCSFVAFFLCKTFRSVIRHSTLRETWKLGVAVLLKVTLLFLLVISFSWYNHIPNFLILGVLLDSLITIFLLLGMRVVMIISYDILKFKYLHRDRCKRILVFGTNEKEIALMMRLQNSPHHSVVGFLSYGRMLKSHTIADHPVYYFENKESIDYLAATQNIDAVLFASYEAAQAEKERLIKYCAEVGVRVLIAPPIDEVIEGKLTKQNIREIRVEDLLGREEIKISLTEIHANFQGKTIMVTGAAGSIGSELCRQLAKFDVARLILFDNAETPMHNMRLDLLERYPQLEFIPVIGDVRMPARLDFAFQAYQPQIVFHAAAYKHVPLMEENPCEAILANIIGTRNVADRCLKYGIEKMVMISTDKAVNPTNVMGASKRLAEIYVQSLGQAIASKQIKGATKFVTTRFGNVLGSNGSVIPYFRKQIERGGPVTVTHKDITRFFMTIPEACRLVMEAATLSQGNEIFVFEMGKPVKIVDLATRMIELAGFRVNEEIKITFTGLRPGEKLYEEVLSDMENTLPTKHAKIRIAKVRTYDYIEAQKVVTELEQLARDVKITEAVCLMKQTVPEFLSKNSPFEKLDQTTHAKIA
ncbi:MAG: nucleoside-diphosphate sugar epimerase/dehydratase [Alistipes sp.]